MSSSSISPPPEVVHRGYMNRLTFFLYLLASGQVKSALRAIETVDIPGFNIGGPTMNFR